MLLTVFALTGLSVLAALSLHQVWDCCRAAWMLRSFPGPPLASLISGHVALLNDPKCHAFRVEERLSERYQGLFRLRLFWRQVWPWSQEEIFT